MKTIQPTDVTKAKPVNAFPPRNAAELAVACLSFDKEWWERGLIYWAVALEKPQRRKLLEFADRAGLTLHLWRVAASVGLDQKLPERAEYEERLRKNMVRLQRRKQETGELLELFRGAGLRPAVLKGFTLEPDFVRSAQDRAQYDLDFYFSPEEARAAYDLLRAQGYQPVAGGDGAGDRRPLDHLPSLVRKTGWEWRGDFFDVEIPAAIDLHFRLWDPQFERIPLELHPEPLTRLVERDGIPVLDRQDQLAACVLHALRHLFRGSLRLSHLYEIAYFLDTHASDSSFWREWDSSPNIPLRSICVTGFGLAAFVFLCHLTQLEDEFYLLPPRASIWLQNFAGTVLEPERSHKVEVLLQLSLVEGWRNWAVVLRRRLLPLSLPDPIDAVHLPAGSLSPRRRLLRAARQSRFVASRALFHLRALPGFFRAAAVWWRA